MSFQISVDIEGVGAIIEKFHKLPKGLQKKYVRSAINAAAKPALTRLKTATPKGPTGNLRKSAGVKVEISKRGGVTARIGYRRGGKFKGYHAWWFEGGVKPHSPKGRAFKVPRPTGRKYGYLKGFRGSGNAVFLARTKGYEGVAAFEKWTDAELPAIKRRMIATLQDALKKAMDEQARRKAREGKK